MITVFTWLFIFAACYVAFAGWLTFGRGAFRFVYWRPMGWLLERISMDGMAIGARCYARTPDLISEFPNGLEPLNLPSQSPARRWWRHERQHNRQFRVRPFMAPVYLYWQLKEGYQRNPLEEEARNAESE